MRIGKVVRIALAIVAVALVGVIVWRAAQPPDEPVYKDKPLSSWLEKAARTGTHTDAAWQDFKEAVRQAGTNAIPTLLRLLCVNDSALKTIVINWAEMRHGNNKSRYTRSMYLNATAIQGFKILGATAQSAVPALIDLGDRPDVPRVTRSDALYSLGYIGPPAKEAVPSLLRWATNADGYIRTAAIVALGNVDPEAASKAGIKTYMMPPPSE